MKRLKQLKSLLLQKELDGALLSSVPNIIYLTNFAYFSHHEREAFLLITPNNNYILTDARYSHAVKKHLKHSHSRVGGNPEPRSRVPDGTRRSKKEIDSWFASRNDEHFELLEISADHSLTDLLKNTLEKEKVETLGLETNNITFHEADKIKSLVKQTKHFDLSSLRQIKTPEEIELIKKACELGDRAFAYILQQIKLGMTEKELAFELEHFIRKNGAEPSFPTIVAFQENAAVPHHKTGNRKLNKNEFVLMDFGVKYQEYCSDMTRTIFFGRANGEQKKAYQTVLEAQNKAVNYLELALSSLSFPRRRESIKIIAADIDNAARQHILNSGFPSIPHSLGHGIGLEVHEAPSLSPNSKDKLKEGMVFSIEPGIYLNDNFGIRIEDLFAIQNGKLTRLTNSPNEMIEI